MAGDNAKLATSSSIWEEYYSITAGIIGSFIYIYIIYN